MYLCVVCCRVDMGVWRILQKGLLSGFTLCICDGYEMS